MAHHQPKLEPREHRYSLRESNKVPLRYREYVVEGEMAQQQQQQLHFQHQGTSQPTPTVAADHHYAAPLVPSSVRRSRCATPRKQPKLEQPDDTEHSGLPPPPLLHREQPFTAVAQAQPQQQQLQQHVVVEQGDPMQQIFDAVIGAEQEVSTSGAASYNIAETKPSKSLFRFPSQFHPHRQPWERRYAAGAELSDELKMNLRKLKNVLKLPQARRFVFCEFFYSGVDQQLFLAENEFSQLMQESFPNLKCTKLRKAEWREIRRLIGKPRRCSQAFLDEEREALEAKRRKIRAIYNGTCTSLEDEFMDLPTHLPRPPIVGQKIYARVRTPRDGIYAATVDAITQDGYRVVFDREDVLPAAYIKDYEVMFDQPTELLSINYFLEQNRANVRLRGAKPTSAAFLLNHHRHHFYPSPAGVAAVAAGGGHGHVLGVGASMNGIQNMHSPTKNRMAIPKDEKVGNFPVRMLVILVKLCKVVEYKKKLVSNLTVMNDYAEKINLLGSTYPLEFKVQFAQLVIDLETVNRLFRNYLVALQTHYTTLLPHLSEPHLSDRPELLRKQCNTTAYQIVKHCNSELNVRNKRILQLITSLASIMLQLRNIGAQNKKFTASDMNLLSESLKQIRAQITPQNAAAFQDYVEVHMRQILNNRT
uniref:DIRP domain-containing protein n=1 Tax=Globodera pallida TaxID=36090 RepID=A0A183C4E1_GLOPA